MTRASPRNHPICMDLSSRILYLLERSRVTPDRKSRCRPRRNSKEKEIYRMKFTSFVRQSSRTFLLAALLLSKWAVPAGAQSESLDSREGFSALIEGSWLVTVNVPAANLSFTAITTFAAGGVSSSTGAYDRLAQNSPLLGTWKRTGATRFDRTAYFFQFDSLGVPLRMLKNKEVYDLKRRNQFEGEGRQYACDLDGENCVDQTLRSALQDGSFLRLSPIDKSSLPIGRNRSIKR